MHDVELRVVTSEGALQPASEGAETPALDLPAAKPADRRIERYLSKFGVTNQYARAAWYCAGQMGLNGLRLLCSLIDPSTRNHARIFGMNTDAGQIVGIFQDAVEGNAELGRWLDLEDSRRFNLFQLGEGKGAGGRPERADEIFEAHAEVIASVMDNIDIAVPIGGLGGGTASGVLPRLVELLHERKAKVGTLAVTTMPFRFEANRFDRADEARKKIAEFAPVVTIYNQFIYELAGRPEFSELARGLKEGDFDEAVKRINESVIARILRTINQLIFSEKAIFRRDSEDWRRILEGKKSAYVGSYEFEGNVSAEDNLDEVLTMLLNDPSQSEDIVPNSDIALVLYQGHFSPDEMDAITGGINAEMKQGEATKSVEVIVGYDGSFEGRSISLLTVSPDLPDAKKSSAASTPRSTRRAHTGTAQSELATGMRVARDPRAETLNPFNKITLEELFEPYSGSARMLMLQFRGEDSKVAVSVPPKVFELIQYLERNWKQWSTAEFQRHYGLLRDYFLRYPETLNKHWLPEGMERLISEGPAVTEADRNKLVSSWLPSTPKKK